MFWLSVLFELVWCSMVYWLFVSVLVIMFVVLCVIGVGVVV